MKQNEKINRNKLQENKPLVYKKIKEYENKPFPIIQLQYSYKCNFKCKHCSIKKTKNKNKRIINSNDVKEFFNQADEMGFSRMTISGGEPLFFKNLDQLVKSIGSKRFWISIDTNCWNLTQDVAYHLKDIGIDRIQPSLDSLNEEEHDNFRGMKGSFKRVLNSVQIAKKANLAIFMQTVVTHSRLHSQEFLDYIKFFNDQNVGVFVSFAKPVGSWENNFDDLIIKEDLKFMEELEKQYNVFTHLTPGYGVNEERMCVASRNIFSITANADVIPCPYFYTSMGNLFEEKLKTIYNRCIKLKPFKKQTCLLAEDKEFINKYLVNKIYGKELPVNWKEVFTDDDFEKNE